MERKHYEHPQSKVIVMQCVQLIQSTASDTALPAAEAPGLVEE